MAPKKKEYVDFVPPVSGNGVTYEIISRQITENAHRQWPDVEGDPYNEIVEVVKKTCYGNPEETFETYETWRYRKYLPVVELPTKVTAEVKVKKEEKVNDGKS
tara:strand:+ start:45 stop:353 length:309 start_codon:yes stop_codon:yes gene_type:complete